MQNTQPTAFHRLAIDQADQQPRRAIRGRVARAQPRQSGEFADQRGQLAAQRQRQVVLDARAPAVLRPRLQPTAQHVRLVARIGAEASQALADPFDAHRWGPHRSLRRTHIGAMRQSPRSAVGSPRA
jgi:hypothetical protein